MRVLTETVGDHSRCKVASSEGRRLRKVMVTLGSRSIYDYVDWHWGCGAECNQQLEERRKCRKWYQGSDHRTRERGMGKTGSLSLKLGTSFFKNTCDMMERTDIDVLLRDAADLCRKTRQTEARRVGVHSGVSQGTRDLSCFDSRCNRCDLPSDPCFMSRG